MFVWFQTLCFLQVQYLVIPSIEQRVRRWEESYGFQAIENKVMGELIKVKSLMFHCAIRLQKPLLVHETAANEVGNGGTSSSPFLTFIFITSTPAHCLTPCFPSSADAGNADKAHESGSDDGSTDMGSFDLNLSLWACSDVFLLMVPVVYVSSRQFCDTFHQSKP